MQAKAKQRRAIDRNLSCTHCKHIENAVCSTRKGVTMYFPHFHISYMYFIPIFAPDSMFLIIVTFFLLYSSFDLLRSHIKPHTETNGKYPNRQEKSLSKFLTFRSDLFIGRFFTLTSAYIYSSFKFYQPFSL